MLSYFIFSLNSLIWILSLVKLNLSSFLLYSFNTIYFSPNVVLALYHNFWHVVLLLFQFSFALCIILTHELFKNF